MADRDATFRYPLAVQFALPERWRDEPGFAATLDGLAAAGLAGVELNVADPFSLDWPALLAALGSHGLALWRFASGLTAKSLGLSLSDPDERGRRRSVDACRRMIWHLAGTGAGLIIGFLKGPAAADRTAARARFAASIAELAADAADGGVPLVVEATNRYESAVANALDDTAALLPPGDARGRWVQVLPDTFHMNIEEADAPAALAKHAALYASVHLSDNNRLFPGRGAIDFGRVIGTLRGIGWRGWLAIEGTVTGDLVADTRAAVGALAPHLA
jgi:sugar phosphate isomerase/epimerase